MGLGRAAAAVVESPRPQVVVVRDTRESGPMLEAAVAAGIAEAGGDCYRAGVLPTPAASILARRLGHDLAVVISASHNPWRDNGIKFFDAAGRKLDERAERAIEAALGAPAPAGEEGAIGRVHELEGGLEDYLRELESRFSADFSGTRVVLDCANGSAYRAAPAIFTRLGAEVEVLFDQPDGRNINEGCGSTHPERLAERVATAGAALGFAFDGDGDRVLAVDSAGRVRDGDELIALIAAHLRDRGELPGGVAVTVMSNYGLHRAMAEAGIDLAVTPVGDRSVSAELERRGWELGGEQSGHLIWTSFAPTGDGIAAALLTAQALGGRDLAALRPIERLPQVLENVRVADSAAVEGAAALWEAVEAENRELGDRGRVLVRPSGTEPLVRVMVEAPEQAEAEAVAARLAALADAELG